MWLGVVKVLGLIFGVKQGASVLNAAGGVANTLTAAAVIPYLATHSADQISLGSISLGACAIAWGIGFVVIEVARRLHPSAGGGA